MGCTLIERKKRLKSILPRHKLIAFSRHRKTFGTKFFEEAERRASKGSWPSAPTASIFRVPDRTTG